MKLIKTGKNRETDHEQSHFEIARLPLREIIGAHQAVKSLSALSIQNFLLHNDSMLCETGLKDLLHLVPIVVTQTKRSTFVIAGFRTYQLAKIILGANSTQLIPVLILKKKARTEELMRLASASVFSVPLAHGLNKQGAAQLGFLACELDPRLMNSQRGRKGEDDDNKLKDIFVGLKSLTALATYLNVHPSTMRSWIGQQGKLNI